MTQAEKFNVAELFSDYRAEWSTALFGDLFIVPPYFERLESARPSFLIGGRGTGKTTALRSLRFDATRARLNSRPGGPSQMPYFGLYVRINKNRVRALQGGDFAQAMWHRAFSHYFNVLCGLEFCRLVEWLKLDAIDLTSVAFTFGLQGAHNQETLALALKKSLHELELYVNNPSRLHPPTFSPPETPVREFADLLQKLPACQDRAVFCCIDEYENLLDYQQSILNTYIKHSEPPLSYKIGVRRGGLRNRQTLGAGDAIVTPDDYVEIDIASESFDTFATHVVQHRLDVARQRSLQAPDDVDQLLPEMPFSIEAEKLGCARIADDVIRQVGKSKDGALLQWVSSLPKSQSYFIKYWAEGSNEPLLDLARSWMMNPEPWTTRLGNYGYASLFWLSRGRKGARVRKYYAGTRTLLALASGNIRYFIELIDEALRRSLADVSEGGRWPGYISAEHQTEAAKAVGKRRLAQLEGLSEHAADIKRLVLALGKVFFERARDPVGRSPETAQFVLGGVSSDIERVSQLLYEGVADLAFEAMPRTKATTDREMRDDEFRLHPIFAAFFEITHRKKRRCTVNATDLLQVLHSPSAGIARILGRQGTPNDELPTQLALFSSFYASGESEESEE